MCGLEQFLDYDFKSSMIFLEVEENLSINKTDEKGVVFEEGANDKRRSIEI
jgi:hypothetical protein